MRILTALIATIVIGTSAFSQEPHGLRDYRLLSTNKTSTMEKELNEAGLNGYRFEKVMGGETAYGGKEAVVIMSRLRDSEREARYSYKLLATNKTSTMQKELQEAANDGFEYRDQTVFQTSFGGNEVVIIVEKDQTASPRSDEYKLLATSKTSTMQKELQEAADQGFEFVGLTVAKTAFGGKEIVTILRKSVVQQRLD